MIQREIIELDEVALEEIARYYEEFEDIDELIDEENIGDYRPTLRKSNKRSRAVKHKNKLKRLYAMGAFRVRSADWDDPNSRLILESHGCNRVRFYKNYSNRKVRRYKGEIKKGNYYRERRVNNY